MKKKYIFLDLDGTLIDHSINDVRPKTLEAIRSLKENGHELFIATGRPPSLFYGIEKTLEIESYIAANGSIASHKGNLILNQPIKKEIINELVDYCFENKIDVGFEGLEDYVVNSRFGDLIDKFSDKFHLHYPEVFHNYHLTHNIYQMVMFYNQLDYKKFETMFPGLQFNLSNEYGLDINQIDGLKDLGVRAVRKYMNLEIEDIIAVGDGLNDISMIEYAGVGIAMGNADQAVKDRADIIAGNISDEGFYKVFKELGLI